jgi:hypothetical protein
MLGRGGVAAVGDGNGGDKRHRLPQGIGDLERVRHLMQISRNSQQRKGLRLKFTGVVPVDLETVYFPSDGPGWLVH